MSRAVPFRQYGASLPERSIRHQRSPRRNEHPSRESILGRPQPTRVLYVEDNADDATLVSELLSDGGEFRVDTVGRFSDARRVLRAGTCDVMLLDLALPDGGGLPLVETAMETNADIPIVVLTGNEDEQLAILAVNSGVQDYLVKDSLDASLLGRTLRHAIERHKLVRELKWQTAKATHYATHDPLTGLGNRQLYFHTLAKTLEAAKRDGHKVAVLFLDIDQFKRMNDVHGHSMGDDLLKRTAGLLTQVVRKSDEVARLGGDEFTVTLPYGDGDGDPARVAESLVRRFVNLSPESANVGTGLSVGIAVFPEDGANMAALIQNADRAMYAAKNSGGNRYHFFSAAMEQDSVRRLRLESDIAAAVGTTQLYLEYQPQIDVLAGSIRGVEALLRWKHPTSGLVPPDRFVSIAEKNGCIVPIGRWALVEGCQQMRKWVELGLGGIRLAVNVSARQLRHPGFVDLVSDALNRAALAPDHLELEITESTFVSPNLDASRIFGELQELGVSISIDDFGTGYSTFDALRRLPVDGLKIDRSFLTDGLESEKNAKIVEAIVAMGATLGLTVVAEGVETKGEVDFLKRCQCRIIQGFYFAHPMSAQELGRMAAEPARWTER